MLDESTRKCPIDSCYVWVHVRASSAGDPADNKYVAHVDNGEVLGQDFPRNHFQFHASSNLMLCILQLLTTTTKFYPLLESPSWSPTSKLVVCIVLSVRGNRRAEREYVLAIALDHILHSLRHLLIREVRGYTAFPTCPRDSFGSHCTLGDGEMGSSPRRAGNSFSRLAWAGPRGSPTPWPTYPRACPHIQCIA